MALQATWDLSALPCRRCRQRRKCKRLQRQTQSKQVLHSKLNASPRPYAKDKDPCPSMGALWSMPRRHAWYCVVFQPLQSLGLPRAEFDASSGPRS